VGWMPLKMRGLTGRLDGRGLGVAAASVMVRRV
jgi:hypothetical protein